MSITANSKKIMTSFLLLLSFSLIFPSEVVQAAESNVWNYQAKEYKDVQNGTFDDIIWDDATRQFQLHGKTLYEDFSMYDDVSDMSSQGWVTYGDYEENNVASILKKGDNHQLYLNRADYYVNNLGMSREFSPTKSGELEFLFTPTHEASRVAINHYPEVELSNGTMSKQFMFRFQKGVDGRNRIVYGTNHGYTIKGKEYDDIYDAFEYGEPQHIRMKWDLENGKGISIYLNGELVVENFYTNMLSDDFYFYEAEFAVGGGGRPISGLIGGATYDYVSLEQSFNLSGQYTSPALPLDVSSTKVLEKNMTAQWSQELPTGTSVQLQTRISSNGGASWSSWSTISNSGNIPGMNKGITINSNTRLQYRVQMESSRNNITPAMKNLTFQTSFDTTPPELNVNLSTENWTNQNVEIAIEGSDNVEVNYVLLPNGTTVNSEDFTYTVGENGDYTFEVKDTAGNTTTESITVSNIDKTKPNVVANPTSKNWTNQSIPVTLNFQDQGSGIATKQYKWSTSTSTPTSWNTYTGTTTKHEEGVHYLHYRAVDRAGNVKVGHFGPYKIDKTKPTARLSSELPDWTRNSITFVVEGSDGQSGLDTIIGPHGETTDIIGKFTYTADKNGTYDFLITDKAGNTFVYRVEVNTIDQNNPTLELSKNPNDWTNEEVEITAVGKDSQSGVSLVYLVSEREDKNLTAMHDILKWNGNEYRKENLTISFKPNESHHGGFYIPYNLLKENQSYVLSFEMKKNSGSIPIIGGHSKLSTNTEVYIDGRRVQSNESGTNNDWTKGIPYVNDNNYHEVVIKFNVDNMDSHPDRNLYIQPNRDNYRYNYDVTFRNIQLEKGTVHTAYEPNSKDLMTGTNPATIKVKENGVYTFEVIDNVGNTSRKSIVVDNIDTDSPIVDIQELSRTESKVNIQLHYQDQ